MNGRVSREIIIINKMAEQASCCWQCSEYCVDFAELLTAIESLNGEKDYVTEEDIIQKMAVEVNVTGVARSYKIRDTLKYATDASYEMCCL